MPLALNKIKKQVENCPQGIKAIIAVPSRFGGGTGPFEEHGQTKNEEVKEQAKDTMTPTRYYVFSIVHSIINHSF